MDITINDGPREESLLAMLAYLQEHGSYVSLNWDEEDRLWECEWITGGRRFSELAMTPAQAITRARDAAINVTARKEH